jgi:hypothetical protein
MSVNPYEYTDQKTGEIVDYAAACYAILQDVLTVLRRNSVNIAATILASEYYNNVDLDSDNKIYGVDFYITDAPPILAHVPKKGSPMTWVYYQAEHPELFE